MIWEWIINAIKDNLIFFILLLFILIGLITTHVIDWPERRFTHPITYIEDEGLELKEREGLYYNWHGWVMSNYINFLLLAFIRLVPKMSTIDRDAYYSYLFFTAFSFYSYYMIGWPEPKIQIIIAYCSVVTIFILIRIWRLLKLQ